LENTSLADLPEVDPNSLDVCQIEVGPKIGEGQFAKVFIGRFCGEHVAVKKQMMEDGGLQEYMRLELKVLQFCEHEHVLKYVGCYVESGATWIVTEYVACGDLLRLLEDAESNLEWYHRVRIARELSEAVAYLHGRNLMHRDVKSSNVLLDSNWRVKLGDFGLATEVRNGRCATLCGTHEYMAPELHLGEQETYGFSVDVYALGMVFLELAFRAKAQTCAPRSPRDCFRLDEAYLRERMASSQAAPSSFVELTMQCVAYEDYERLECEDVRAWLEELVLEFEPPPQNTKLEFPESGNDSSSDSGSVASATAKPPFAGAVPSSSFDVETDELPYARRDDPPLSSGASDRGSQRGGSHLFVEKNVVVYSSAATSQIDDERDDEADRQETPTRVVDEEEHAQDADSQQQEQDASPPVTPPPPPEEEEDVSPRARVVPAPREAQKHVKSLKQQQQQQRQSRRPGSRGSGRGLALLAARRIHSLKEVGIDTTRMVGFLNKKTRTSFAARYQRRWFVVKSGTLLWFSQPGNANALGRLQLAASHELVATGKTKFAIYASSSSSNGKASPTNHSSILLKSATSPPGKRKALLELAAPDEKNKDMWMHALQAEINECGANWRELPPRTNGFLTPVPSSPTARSSLGSSGGGSRPNTRDSNKRIGLQTPEQQSSPPRDEDDGLPLRGGGVVVVNQKVLDVEKWIEMLKLPPETATSFRNAGYANLGLIFEMGLTDEDLDYVKLKNPLHRRLLKAAASEGFFASELASCVTDYRNSGHVAFYVVTSRYKFRRSTLHLRYANFVTLYAKLRSLERERSQTSSPFAECGEPLPKLPGSRVFVDSKGPLFLEQRRKELDDYLQHTIHVANDDPKLRTALLAFLQVGDVDAAHVTDRSTSSHHNTLGSSPSRDGGGVVAGVALPVD